jgi:hypothetical membrane protein
MRTRARSNQNLLPALAAPERAFLFGAIAWMSSVQFFIAQFVVQSAWRTPFSLTRNYISDLGNTACGPFPVGSSTYVCSPWHAGMNASFTIVGLAVIVGAALVRNAFVARLWRWGLAFVAVAGLGFVLVGMFPENENFPPHRLGATLQFVCGNLGQVVLGASMLKSRARWAAYSITSGAVGLLATTLFASGHYLGMRIGGMERLAAYPLPIWTIVMGIALRRHGGQVRPRSDIPSKG